MDEVDVKSDKNVPILKDETNQRTVPATAYSEESVDDLLLELAQEPDSLQSKRKQINPLELSGGPGCPFRWFGRYRPTLQP